MLRQLGTISCRTTACSRVAIGRLCCGEIVAGAELCVEPQPDEQAPISHKGVACSLQLLTPHLVLVLHRPREATSNLWHRDATVEKYMWNRKLLSGATVASTHGVAFFE